jgi:hypothetical protein
LKTRRVSDFDLDRIIPPKLHLCACVCGGVYVCVAGCTKAHVSII